MLLWAEDVDVPLDTARQAVQHVHAQHMAQITQYGTASHVALAEPLQSLMLEAIIFFFFFGRERYSLHKCNDSNLKSM